MPDFPREFRVHEIRLLEKEIITKEDLLSFSGKMDTFPAEIAEFQRRKMEIEEELLYLQAKTYFFMGNFAKAVEVAQGVVHAGALGYWAASVMLQGNVAKGYPPLHEASELARDNDDDFLSLDLFSLQAFVYSRAGLRERVKATISKAVKLFNETELAIPIKRQLFAYIFEGQAREKISKKDIPSARKLYSVITDLGKSYRNTILMIIGKKGVGFCYQLTNKMGTSLDTLLEAKQLADSFGSRLFRYETSSALSDYYWVTENYPLSLEYLTKAHKEAKASGAVFWEGETDTAKLQRMIYVHDMSDLMWVKKIVSASKYIDKDVRYKLLLLSGFYYAILKKYDFSHRVFRFVALATRESLSNQFYAFLANLELAKVATQTGNFDDGSAYLEKAAGNAKTKEQMADVYLAFGQLYIAFGQPEYGEKYFTLAQRKIEQYEFKLIDIKLGLYKASNLLQEYRFFKQKDILTTATTQIINAATQIKSDQKMDFALKLDASNLAGLSACLVDDFFTAKEEFRSLLRNAQKNGISHYVNLATSYINDLTSEDVRKNKYLNDLLTSVGEVLFLLDARSFVPSLVVL